MLLRRKPPPRLEADQLKSVPHRSALAAEFAGTLLLVAANVGSGIAAVQLFPGVVGLQLLTNAGATGLALAAIIAVFAPVSGAHFNPAVTLALGGDRRYIPMQLAGGFVGTVVANLMFGLPAISMADKVRMGPGLWLGELIATLALLALCASPRSTPGLVGAFVGAAHMWSSSTGLANPAVTIARMFSDTFTGVAPASAPALIAIQLVAALLVGIAVAGRRREVA